MPTARPSEAPTLGSGWANTPGVNYNNTKSGATREGNLVYGSAASPYLPSTPGIPPMTPSSNSYVLGTPGGQPMTPVNVGSDMMPLVMGTVGFSEIDVVNHSSRKEPKYSYITYLDKLVREIR